MKGVSERFKPLLFVVFTLGLWWAIATSAFITATCIPEGRRCVFSPPLEMRVVAAVPTSALHVIGEGPAIQPAAAPSQRQGQGTQSTRRWRDFLPMPSKRDVLVLVSLIAALFVAKGIVYPYDDLSKPAR